MWPKIRLMLVLHALMLGRPPLQEVAGSLALLPFAASSSALHRQLSRVPRGALPQQKSAYHVLFKSLDAASKVHQQG
jgi:hypothetical protein